MRASLVSAVLALVLGTWLPAAHAVGSGAMVGKWTWEAFTVKVSKGGPHGLSCKVVDGPKNVGMEMIRSEPKLRSDFFVARVKHPANGKIYHTKITRLGPDTWRLDGCTDGGACATGVFERTK